MCHRVVYQTTSSSAGCSVFLAHFLSKPGCRLSRQVEARHGCHSLLSICLPCPRGGGVQGLEGQGWRRGCLHRGQRRVHWRCCYFAGTCFSTLTISQDKCAHVIPNVRRFILQTNLSSYAWPYLQIKSVGCDYVVIGHSERRHGNIASETDAMFNKKVFVCVCVCVCVCDVVCVCV